MRPYASLTTNCVDFSLDDNLAVFSDPINIEKPLPSLLAFPVDIDRADMFLEQIQKNNRPMWKPQRELAFYSIG